jgi:hypothetical protein
MHRSSGLFLILSLDPIQDGVATKSPPQHVASSQANKTAALRKSENRSNQAYLSHDELGTATV